LDPPRPNPMRSQGTACVSLSNVASFLLSWSFLFLFLVSHQLAVLSRFPQGFAGPAQKGTVQPKTRGPRVFVFFFPVPSSSNHTTNMLAHPALGWTIPPFPPRTASPLVVVFAFFVKQLCFTSLATFVFGFSFLVRAPNAVCGSGSCPSHPDQGKGQQALVWRHPWAVCFLLTPTKRFFFSPPLSPTPSPFPD